MGLLDLIRPLREHARRRRIAVLLVAATFLAELLDVLGEGHSAVTGGASVSGAEAAASLAGLLTAGVLGHHLAASRPAGTGRTRTVALAIAVLFGALLVHETGALLLDAGHGETALGVVEHVLAGVLPVAAVLGAIVALLAGVHVVRRAVTRRRACPPVDVVVPLAPRRLVVPRHTAASGLLRSLRLAGRAPPVPARG